MPDPADPRPRLADDRLVRWGGVGALVAAVCCFTPALVWVLGAAGLAAVVGYVDLVLLPVLAVALLALYVGVRRVRRRQAACDLPPSP